MGLYQEVVLKLVLAFLLGGIIGYQREHKNRPAGLRTHILVCIGSALVQITSINYYALSGTTSDPMRLGAQVISGIGFLGAGTIIKEGATIKGLTTAAGLWAVACIGLAVGTGLYVEAIIASILLFLSLSGFKRLESSIGKDKKIIIINLLVKGQPGKLGEIGKILGEMNIQIINIEMNTQENFNDITLTLKLTYNIPAEEIVDKLSGVEGIKSLNVI